MNFLINLLEYYFVPEKKFDSHFELDHQFHGVKLHHISESYFVKPKSPLAVQLFHEGIYFPSLDLNLKCKIEKSKEQVTVKLIVYDPSVSKTVIKSVKSQLVRQLKYLEKRLNNDPKFIYVQSHCQSCIHHSTKPLNVCVQECEYQPKQ